MPAPRPPTTTTTPPSRSARAVSAPPSPRPARSFGRPATPGRARRRRAHRRLSPPPMVAILARLARPRAGAEPTRWGITAASSASPLSAAAGPAAQGQADRLIDRAAAFPEAGGHPNRSSCPGRGTAPAGRGKPAAPRRPRPATEQATPVPGKKGLRQPGSFLPPQSGSPSSPRLAMAAPGRPRQGCLRCRERGDVAGTAPG